MSTVIASSTFANGLRNEFTNTYTVIRNRVADSRLGMVMDLSMGATNRQHEFAYFKAPPHAEYWKRGSTIPTGAFDDETWSTPIYEWARRIPFNKNDRKDDQTGSMLEVANATGRSFGLLPERFFFDLLLSTTTTLPAVPLAPDGVALFSTTDGAGDDRFGASDGNSLTGSGVTTITGIRTDYYNGLEQFGAFRDGQGQPLLLEDIIDAGVLIVFGLAYLEAFEETFLQKRQGEETAVNNAGVTPSNVIQDASRNVRLWATTRISDDSWYMFLLAPPKLPTYHLTREGLSEKTALEDDNNSDYVRDTGNEYIQWESREGAGIALPYAAMRIDNS